MSSHRKPNRGARLDDWLEKAEAILAEQRSQSISPSVHGGNYGELLTSTQTLGDFELWLPKALELLSLDPGRWILIAEDAASQNRYVQVLAYEDGSLMAETVSNINLRPEEQWDTECERLLARIGWRPPEDDKSPNWWVVYRTATPPLGELAQRIRCTLRTVMGMRSRDELTVKMFSSPKRGRTPASAMA